MHDATVAIGILACGMGIVVGLGFAAAGWWLQPLGRRRLGGPALAGIALTVLGLVRDLDWYPWSNAVVVATAISAGGWFGNFVAPRFRPMLAWLVGLAVLDSLQLVAGSSGASVHLSAFDQWLHLVWLTGDGAYMKLGIADLILTTALAAHWRRRDAPMWVGLAAGPLGLFGSAVYAWLVRPRAGLVLIPFLLAGWLVSEWMYRRTHRGAVAQREG